MVVWTNVSGGARKQTYSNHTFVDVAWRYADGMALQFQGLGGRFDNCVWEWNSWTGLGSIEPGDWYVSPMRTHPMRFSWLQDPVLTSLFQFGAACESAS